MEGDCPTISNVLTKRSNDDLHDSGCEQSPTTPSPTHIEEHSRAESEPSSSQPVITYDRVSVSRSSRSVAFEGFEKCGISRKVMSSC